MFNIKEQSYYHDNEYYGEISDEIIEAEGDAGNLYYGRNVIWIGESGKMIKAYADNVYPIDGNIFYDDKLEAVQDIINQSEDRVYFYAPYGSVDKIGLTDVIESIKYEKDKIYPRVLTTGEEELDEYILDETEWLENNFFGDTDIHFDDLIKFVKSGDTEGFKQLVIEQEYQDEEDARIAFSDFAKLKELYDYMEDGKKYAVENEEGDLGSIFIQIRDGNHRAFGALAAGEPYIWVKVQDSQIQNIDKEDSFLKSIVESVVSECITQKHIDYVSGILK